MHSANFKDLITNFKFLRNLTVHNSVSPLSNFLPAAENNRETGVVVVFADGEGGQWKKNPNPLLHSLAHRLSLHGSVQISPDPFHALIDQLIDRRYEDTRSKIREKTALENTFLKIFFSPEYELIFAVFVNKINKNKKKSRLVYFRIMHEARFLTFYNLSMKPNLQYWARIYSSNLGEPFCRGT